MFPLKNFHPILRTTREVCLDFTGNWNNNKKAEQQLLCLSVWLTNSLKEPITSFTFQSFFVGDKVPRQNFNGGVRIYLHHA